MLRLGIFVFLMNFWSVTAFSQSTVTAGPAYPKAEGKVRYYFEEGGAILVVRLVERQSVELQILDAATLRPLKSTTVDDFPKGCSIENVLAIRGRYYVFYWVWENKQEQLFAREIDFVSGTFKGTGKRIVTVEGKVDWTVERPTLGHEIVVGDKFHFYVSRDSSTLLVQYIRKQEKGQDKDVVGLHVFDANVQNKWSKEVTMPYTDKQMRNDAYAVDQSGNAYIVTHVGEGKKNGTVEILRYAAGTAAMTVTPVSAANTDVKEFKLYETAQATMIGAGLYAERDRKGIDGVLLAHLPATGAQVIVRKYEMPLEMNTYYSENKTKQDNSDDARMVDVKLTDVFVYADGSVMIVGEHQDWLTHSSPIAFYEYYDMLVARISATGTLSWMKRLPKRQQSLFYDQGKSYNHLFTKGMHYFLLLDNDKNLALEPFATPAPHMDLHGGYLTAWQLNDKTGELKKFSVFETQKVKQYTIPSFRTTYATDVSDNTVVYEQETERRKEYVLIRVELGGH